MTQVNLQKKHILSFEIFVITAEIDGYFDPRENDVIKEYFSGKNIVISDFFESIDRLKKIPHQLFAEHLKKSTIEFAALSTQEEKEDLILHILKLINADNEIKISESQAFTTVYNILNKKKFQ